MTWLLRVTIFVPLLTLAIVALGGNIGPYELLLLPVAIIFVMWGGSRLLRLGRHTDPN